MLKEARIVPLPAGVRRMESGIVQFGRDWPGVFLRGDEAVGYGQILLVAEEALKAQGKLVEAGHVRAMIERFSDCIVGGAKQALNDEMISRGEGGRRESL